MCIGRKAGHGTLHNSFNRSHILNSLELVDQSLSLNGLENIINKDMYSRWPKVHEVPACVFTYSQGEDM